VARKAGPISEKEVRVRGSSVWNHSGGANQLVWPSPSAKRVRPTWNSGAAPTA